jgi:hypothetical protein
MIARVGNDPCPLRLPNEWLSPCAASTLPSVGLEICASCATRGTCIRTHLFPTPCREAAITGFGDHPNASITRCIAGCFRFFILTQSGDRPARYGRPAHRERRAARISPKVIFFGRIAHDCAARAGSEAAVGPSPRGPTMAAQCARGCVLAALKHEFSGTIK